MTEPKKLTTAEILALARQKKAEAEAAQASESTAPAPETSQAPDAPAAESPAAPVPASPAPPAAQAPQSTADILAAARAAKGTTPAASPPTPSPAAPKSTADILAAARAAKGTAPAASADKPKSTADILAAARAAKGTSPPSTPAADAPPAATPATAPPSGTSKNRPDLKEMVAAVKAAHEGKPAVATKPTPATPKLPAKENVVSRRSAMRGIGAILLSPFIVAWIAMGAIAGAWTLGIARFMMPNMVLELPSKFKVGPPSDFPPGTVSEKFKASRGVYIVHSTQYDGRDLIYGLLSICTHLGCTPNWLEGEQKFKCPCHGSGFYISGINFEGPAPRPLERVGLRRAEDGMLEVDKSVKFQEELGQWADPKSYYVNS